MARIDPTALKPPNDIDAMEEAFESLVESVELSSPDDAVYLREELKVQFDEYYQTSRTTFSIQEVLSEFSNNIWRFAREVATRDGRYSRESIRSAFQAFCKSGELVLDQAGGMEVRDLFSRVSEYQVKYMLWDMDRIGVDLHGAAKILLDDASAIESYAARFEKALSLAEKGDGEGMAELSGLIFGDELIEHMGLLSDAFEDDFFGPFNGRLRTHARLARIAYEQERTQEGEKAVKELSDTFTDVKGAFDRLGKVFMILKSKKLALKKLLKEKSAIEALDRHRPFMRQFASVGHDYTNFLMKMEEYLSRLVNGDDKVADLTRLEDLCEKWSCETVSKLLGLVRLKRQAVAVSAEGLEDFPIPGRKRRPLFRINFEFVTNADKNADKDKEEKKIDFRASLRGSILKFVVEDNGVGIRDVEKVLEEGVRERPDLAKGSGLGLAGIVRMSEENGWNFSLESELGVGTKATLEVDTASWSGGPGGGMGSDMGNDEMISGASAQNMSTFSSTLGAGILLGIAPCLA